MDEKRDKIEAEDEERDEEDDDCVCDGDDEDCTGSGDDDGDDANDLAEAGMTMIANADATRAASNRWTRMMRMCLG